MIRHIWAVGRNYAEHIKELGNTPTTEPMFFLKGGGTLTEGEKIQWPDWAKDVHHELELALQVGKNGEYKKAALALDLTERTKQSELKLKGHPWTVAKSFRGSCPISSFIDIPKNLKSLTLTLKVNGEVRQNDSTEKMIYNPEVLLKFAKKHFPVEENDVILTGTPAGVGPLKEGDKLEATLTDESKKVLLQVNWTVSPTLKT